MLKPVLNNKSDRGVKYGVKAAQKVTNFIGKGLHPHPNLNRTLTKK